MKNSKDQLNVLIKIQKNEFKNQRKLAKKLGFSLGKLNYILNLLKAKGLIKIRNFEQNDHKMNYLYYLTPKGFKAKTVLAINYLKRISEEYEEIKNELKRNK